MLECTNYIFYVNVPYHYYCCVQIDGRDIDLIGESQSGRDITECVNNQCAALPCFNGGTCMVEETGFTCMCPLGYAGTVCTDAGESTQVS